MALNLEELQAAALAPPPSGRTGFVALLGRPNTGKSTLLNTLLGCHLAAVSNKPQTTRKQLLGIYNDDDSQIMFLDAPGVHQSKLAIDEAMDLSICKALEEADVLVCLLDPLREPGAEDGMVALLAAKAAKPALLVLNKTDASTAEQRQQMLEFYRHDLPEAPAFNLTATDKASAQELIGILKTMLPEGPFLFDRESITDVYERDVAAELIREALLEELQQEIPHCIAVTIDSWKEQESGIAIEATLNLERENHKGIIIGQGGRMIRHLRNLSAEKIARFCQTKVTLALHLKIVPNWRKKNSQLKNFKLLD